MFKENPKELDHKTKKIRLRKATGARAQNNSTSFDGLNRTKELIQKLDEMINPNKG